MELLTTYSFPRQVFHVPSTSNTLRSPLHFQLYPHRSIPHPVKSFLQASWACHTLPGLQCLSLKCGGRLHDPITVACCMPPKPSSCRQCQCLLQLKQWLGPLGPHSSGLWVPGWLKHFPKCLW
jgi:hypothetical protein